MNVLLQTTVFHYEVTQTERHHKYTITRSIASLSLSLLCLCESVVYVCVSGQGFDSPCVGSISPDHTPCQWHWWFSVSSARWLCTDSLVAACPGPLLGVGCPWVSNLWCGPRQSLWAQRHSPLWALHCACCLYY